MENSIKIKMLVEKFKTDEYCEEVNTRFSNDYRVHDYFEIQNDSITCHNEKIVYKHKGNIFIVNNTEVNITDLLSELLDTKEIYYNSNGIKINGIQWDGKPTNIELFK